MIDTKYFRKLLNNAGDGPAFGTALIVNAVKALPELLDALDAAVAERDDALRTLALVAAALGVDPQALIEDRSIASALRADAEKWRALGSSTSCSHGCPVLCAGSRVSDRVEE